MRSFTDSTGCPWQFHLNIGLAAQVLDATFVDLTSPEHVMSLDDNAYKVADVLAVLCAKGMTTAGIDRAEFLSRLDGDVLERATAVLLEELVSFTQPGRRDALRRALIRKAELTAEAMQRGLTYLDNLNVESLLQELGSPSTGLPESSESTPTPSP